MRLPRTWWDKALLKDEPFLSAFKTRQLAGPPTRQGTGKDDDLSRNEAIAQKFRDKKLVNRVVQVWLDLAFQSHLSQNDIKLQKVKATEPGTLDLFVRFYWALFQNHDSAAVLLLRKERLRRGYEYELDIPTQWGESLASTAESMKLKVHPKQIRTFQIRNDVIDEKTKAQPSQHEDISGKVDHVSNSAFRGQSLQKKVLGSLPTGLKFNKVKKDVSGCPGREEKRFSPTYPPSLDLTSLSETRDPCRIELNSLTLLSPSDLQNTTAVCDLPKTRKRRQPTSRYAFPEKSKQGPLHINGVAADKKAIDHTNRSCNVPDDPTSNQILDKMNRRDRSAGLHFSRISKPETKTDDSPEGQGTSVPQTHQLVSRSLSDHCHTSTICDPSNSRKRRSSNLNALERENHAVPSQEVSVGRLEQAITTSHRETKRRKVVQEEIMADPLKVEPPNEFTIQGGTHPTTGFPAVDKSLSQPMQDKMTSNPKRGRASSFQHKRQEVPVDRDQEDSVPKTAHPNPVKKRRDRPTEVKEFEQEGSTTTTVQLVPRKKRGRPPKSQASSLSQAQLNDGIVPCSGQVVGTKQEISISTCIPFLPYTREHSDLAEEIFTLDCVAPAATQIKDHPADIFPTQKTPLSVNPPIWAQSRQEVCETFDWFRSYQGGVYFAHNTVKGYLLSAFSSKRDRFEHGGRLIISHGGGKAESLHTRKGQTTAQPAADQLAQDKSVRALLDNYRNQRPLVLLIDDKYVLFPYDLGAKDVTYAVLGFYTIAHAWAEYQPTNDGIGYVVRYKFAFRWCDDQGMPWWLTDKETNLSDLTLPSIPAAFSLKPTSKRTPKKQSAVSHIIMVKEAASSKPKSPVCRLCHMDSPHIYTWAWLCLHPDCSGFWRDIQGNLPPGNLEYASGFLELMTSLPIPPDFGKLKPDLPSRLSTDGTATSYAFTRGFHCDSCGRLSCRFKWEKWECSNCEACLPVSRPAHEAKDFWSNLLPIGYKDHFISKKSKIEQQPLISFTHENGMGSIQSFVLPDGRGKIHHIQPGTPLGRLEADGIFIEYQQQATAGELKFRRWPLRSHKCRGTLLTNYFSQNSGEPYQYVGGAANTVSFENAPGAVVKARTLIQKRIRQALGVQIEFNEVLSAAYMERQKMAFHSDNEIGLGPVVAGLSLGSPALMHFRIHAKHDPLRELKGNLLSFVLRHGDILVMDGASVQEYYEHTVIPNNFRIAATARQINPGHAR